MAGAEEAGAEGTSLPRSAPIYLKFCSNAVMRLTPLAGAARIYKLDLRSGDTWTLFGEMRLDAEGRSTARRIDGHGLTRYAPHNCEKVPGICRYTEYRPDGTEAQMLRINGQDPGETDSLWSYTILQDADGQPEIQAIGTVRYAADGLPERESWTETETYTKGCAERLQDPPE
ncbi:MAG: hypothetical protein AAGI13_06955 [Pseudomonadota bacterium]